MHLNYSDVIREEGDRLKLMTVMNRLQELGAVKDQEVVSPLMTLPEPGRVMRHATATAGL